MNWYDEIRKSIDSKVIGLEKSWNMNISSPSDVEDFQKITRNNLLKAEDKAEFEKAWSTDLSKRFPNGSWRTINGAHVFVNGGKVVAGLGGFNKEIDKFFEGKKKESKGNNGKINLRVGNKYNVSFKTDRVGLKSPDQEGEYQGYRIGNTEKFDYNPKTKQMKRVKVDGEKIHQFKTKRGIVQVKDDELKNMISQKQPKTEGKKEDSKETLQKQTKEKQSPTLDTFKDIAKKSSNVADFMDQVRKIKNVSPEVSKEFFDKYGDGGKLSPEKASLNFMKEHGKKYDYQEELKNTIKQSLDKKFNVSGKHGREVGLPLKGVTQIYTDGEYKGKRVDRGVQKDAEKLLDYANEANIKGIKEIKEKYFSEWNKQKSLAGTQRDRYIPINTAKVELHNLANAMFLEAKNSTKKLRDDLPF